MSAELTQHQLDTLALVRLEAQPWSNLTQGTCIRLLREGFLTTETLAGHDGKPVVWVSITDAGRAAVGDPA